MLGWRLAFRARTRRGLLLAAALAAVGVGVAGCGAESDDVFLVRRTGSLPDARVDIVVNDGGTVTCDRGESRELDSKLLLRARDIVRTLDEKDCSARSIRRPPARSCSSR